MDLLNKLAARFTGKKAAKPEYYFALTVNLSQVIAVVWEIFGNRLDIIGRSVKPYQGTEELADQAYKALDQSLGVLEIDPQKVLLGVPDSWSLNDDIKEPYLKLLKQLLKDSELDPLAYVTTTNAISYHLHKQEGVPPTAILIGIGDFVEIALLRGGRVVESKTCQRSENLFEDIEKSLRQLTDVEVLPAKILLYSTKLGTNMEKIKDDLMSHPWMQRLTFLHFPKIDLLDDEIQSKAIIVAAAAEEHPDIDLKHSFATNLARSETVKSLDLAEISEEEKVDHQVPDGDEDLGFVRSDLKPKLKLTNLKKKKEDVLADEPELHQEEDYTPHFAADLEDDNLVSPGSDRTNRQLVPSNTVLNKITGRLPKLPLAGLLRYLPDFSVVTKKLEKFSGKSSGKLMLVPAVLAVVVVAYLLLIKATVVVYVEPRLLEREAEVVADPGVKAVDEAAKIIPGSTVELTVSGTGKEVATGQKQIGDPAKGRVVVFNLTNQKVAVSQGAILTAAGGLKFTLDSAVSVASQSSSVGADLVTVIKPGKSESVGVTAGAIGPEGNLPADTELTVAGYSKSEVVAKVNEALSGGTSKNVTVVTADDQKKLKAEVTDLLRQQAEREAQSKMEEGKKIIADALTVVDGKYNYTKQVGDQASEFSLTATIRFKGTSYAETDLRTIVSKLVSTNVTEGYELDLTSMETQADVAKVEKDGKLVFKAKFRAKMIPKLDAGGIKKQIVGRGVEDVANRLKEMENVVGSEIKLNLFMPGPLSRLPLLEQNINLTVSPK